MIPPWRRRAMADDLRMYRNLLALLPYCVRVRKVPVPPPPAAASSVVLFRPRRRYPGRHVGWS